VSSVTFGTPAQDGIPAYVPFSTAPITVSRDESPPAAEPAAEPAPAEPAAATATAAPPPTPAPAAAGAAGGGDPDKLFEDLYDRLRQQILFEKEQLGDAFREM
jgi:hypothetical protein